MAQPRSLTTRVAAAVAAAVSFVAAGASGQISPDYDGDGAVAPADLSLFIQVWWRDVTTGRVTADANASGEIEPADIAEFLAMWFDGVRGLNVPPPGWTTIVPSADTEVIYVSSSAGDDANDGRTPHSPVATLAAGCDRLRDGFPDWLLLRRGDVWQDQSFGMWEKTGRSRTEPIMVAAYGDGPRPIVRSPAGEAALTRWRTGSTGNLFISGIHFDTKVDGRYEQTGIVWLGGPDFEPEGGTDILIEDCRFSRLFRGVSLEGCTRVAIRRSVFEDMWSPVGEGYSPQPFYINFCSDILVEENYFITRVFAVGQGGVRPPYGQDALGYINDANTGEIVYRRNICVSKGVQGPVGLVVRSNATVEDSVFVGMHTAISAAGQDTPPSGFFPDGTRFTIRGNVILSGVNLTSRPGGERGIGIQVGFTDPSGGGSLIENNIVANKAVSHGFDDWCPGINFDQSYNEGYARNVTVRNNVIYNWNGIVVQPPRTMPPFGLRINGNQIQNPGPTGNENALIDTYTADPMVLSLAGNTYSTMRSRGAWFRLDGDLLSPRDWMLIESAPVERALTYPEPKRSLLTYGMLHDTGGTIDAVIAILSRQSRDRWNPRWSADEVLAYLRAGFGR